MPDLVENRDCYASETQREVLIGLLANNAIAKSFFLTGEKVLSVFYLHHRRSEDIDLFALPPQSLEEISVWVKRVWGNQMAVIKESAEFLSCLIRGVKVDFVVDPLSSKEPRDVISIEGDTRLVVDTINNIASNKFCAAARRMEPKDLIDLYFVFKRFPGITFPSIYDLARKKEVLFDDPPTLAYQLEEAVNLLRDKPELFPQVIVEFDRKDFFIFFEKIASRVYARYSQRKGRTTIKETSNQAERKVP